MHFFSFFKRLTPPLYNAAVNVTLHIWNYFECSFSKMYASLLYCVPLTKLLLFSPSTTAYTACILYQIKIKRSCFSKFNHYHNHVLLLLFSPSTPCAYRWETSGCTGGPVLSEADPLQQEWRSWYGRGDVLTARGSVQSSAGSKDSTAGTALQKHVSLYYCIKCITYYTCSVC